MTNRYTIDVSEDTYRKFCAIGKFLNEPDASTAFDNVVDVAIEALNKHAAKRANVEFTLLADPSMMHPTEFDGANVVLGPPASPTRTEVFSLIAARVKWNGDSALVSSWEPTESQRDALARGERVWLTCMGESMPPVCLTVVNPLLLEGVELA